MLFPVVLCNPVYYYGGFLGISPAEAAPRRTGMMIESYFDYMELGHHISTMSL
jgi:hypothetical protein